MAFKLPFLVWHAGWRSPATARLCGRAGWGRCDDTMLCTWLTEWRVRALLIPLCHTAGHAGYTVQGHVRRREPGARDQRRVPDQRALHSHQRALPAMRVGAGVAIPGGARQGAWRCARFAMGIARFGELPVVPAVVLLSPHCLEGCPAPIAHAVCCRGTATRSAGPSFGPAAWCCMRARPRPSYQPPEELPGAALACAF